MSDSRLFKPFPLNQLPGDVLLEIASYLSVEDEIRLQQTGDRTLIDKMNDGPRLKALYCSKISADILNATPQFKASAPNSDIYALAAIHDLKRGKKHGERLAKLLFETNAEIATLQRDPVGRYIQQSLYQQALATGDVWLLKAIHQHIFPLHPDGEKAAAAMAVQQFEEQFPHYHQPITLDAILLTETSKEPKKPDLIFSDEEKAFFKLEAPYYDKRNIEQIIAAKRALMAVVDAITADDCDDAMPDQNTQVCINTLKTALGPNDNEIIKTGLHFPLFILAMAANVYGSQHVAAYKTTPPVAGAWDQSVKAAEKWSVYSRLVLGLVEKHLTAVDGQSLKNGLGNEIGHLNKEKGPDRQDGIFINAAKGQLPNSAALVGDLGKTAFITLYAGFVGRLNEDPRWFIFVDKNALAGAGKGGGTYFTRRGWRLLEILSYAEQKQTLFRAIMQPIEAKSSRSHDDKSSMRCVIS